MFENKVIIHATKATIEDIIHMIIDAAVTIFSATMIDHHKIVVTTIDVKGAEAVL